MNLALPFSNRHREVDAERASKHQNLALPKPMPKGHSPIGEAMVVGFCQLLMAACKFIYKFISLKREDHENWITFASYG